MGWKRNNLNKDWRISCWHKSIKESGVTREIAVKETAIIKIPNGKLKRWFGKFQKVIEQDIPIPVNAIVKNGGNR